MTREFLNLEAELEEEYIDPWSGPGKYFVVVRLNGHLLYKFETDQVYSIEEKGLKLSEVICDHVKGLLRKDGPDGG